MMIQNENVVDGDYNSRYKLVIKHFGHPINNWGYQILKDGKEVIEENMMVSQYSIREACEVGTKQFIKGFINKI